MQRSELLCKLGKIFKDIFDDDTIELTEDTTAADIEEWDSLMQIRLLIAIEKDFGISLNPIRIVELENIGDMLSYLEEFVFSHE